MHCRPLGVHATDEWSMQLALVTQLRVHSFAGAFATHLVHDDVVDSVFVNVLVVAQPHGEALCIIPLKVLQASKHRQEPMHANMTWPNALYMTNIAVLVTRVNA